LNNMSCKAFRLLEGQANGRFASFVINMMYNFGLTVHTSRLMGRLTAVYDIDEGGMLGWVAVVIALRRLIRLDGRQCDVCRM
jgi:hypothetical protein